VHFVKSYLVSKVFHFIVFWGFFTFIKIKNGLKLMNYGEETSAITSVEMQDVEHHTKMYKITSKQRAK